MKEPAPERHVFGPAPIAAFLAQRLTGPLTVINGHAQLIRRRANGQGGNEAVALERSLVAIELAARQMVEVLVVASGDGAKEELEDTKEHT